MELDYETSLRTSGSYEQVRILPHNPPYTYGTLTKEIGRGGFGTVYETTSKDYAVKVFIDDLGSSDFSKQDVFATTLREIAIMTRISHPNVNDLVDYYFTNQGNNPQIHLVMELADNSLEYMIYHASLSLDDNMSIAYQIIAGVAYLHSRDIIHRDIKPGNVLIKQVGSKYIARISDFGLSRSTGCIYSSGITEIVYSLPYRPPEILLTRPDDYAKYYLPADIWALGCTLYELFTAESFIDYEYIAKIASKEGKSAETLRQQFELLGSISEEQILSIAKEKNIDDTNYDTRWPFYKDQTSHLISVMVDEGIEIALAGAIIRCLRINPSSRISAFNFAKLSIFDPYRNKASEEYEEVACGKNLYRRESYPRLAFNNVEEVARRRSILDIFKTLNENNFEVQARSVNLMLWLFDLSKRMIDFTIPSYTKYAWASLAIAVAYSENRNTADDIMFTVKNTYTTLEANKAVKDILLVVSFDLVQTMAIDFVEYDNTLTIAQYSGDIINMANTLTVLAYFLEFRYQIMPSTIANMCTIMSRIYYGALVGKLDEIMVDNIKVFLSSLISISDGDAIIIDDMFFQSNDTIRPATKVISAQIDRHY